MALLVLSLLIFILFVESSTALRSPPGRTRAASSTSHRLLLSSTSSFCSLSTTTSQTTTSATTVLSTTTSVDDKDNDRFIHSSFSGPSCIILIDGDNVRGKTKFAVSKEELVDDVLSWMNSELQLQQAPLKGRVVLVIIVIYAIGVCHCGCD